MKDSNQKNYQTCPQTLQIVVIPWIELTKTVF